MTGIDGTQAGQSQVTPQDPSVSDQEQAQVSWWADKIKTGYKQDHEAQFKKFKKWRDYVAGRVGDDGKGGLVRVNLIQSTIQALLPHVYAQNPQVDCRPSDSVGTSRLAIAKGFGRTLEIVIGKQFESANLKGVAKRTLRRAMTTSAGWAKVAYQRDIRTDPIIQQRLNDTQDNLERIKALILQMGQDNPDRDEVLRNQAELQQQQAALHDQAEVTVAEGLAIDPVLTEDILVEPGIREIADYRQAGWIAERIWVRPDDAPSMFPALSLDDLKTAESFAERSKDGEAQTTRSATNGEPDPGWLAVWEIWHKSSETVFTWIQGMSKWARPPWQPTNVGERWYPFFLLAFNWVDGERWPLADVEMWIELADEYNRVRTSFSEHRARSRPGSIITAEVSPEDMEKINRRQTGETVAINLPPNIPANQLVADIGGPRIDPALYDTTPVRFDLEIVSGVQDANRGGVDVAKTATEAEIEQSGLTTRISERRDTIEDWVQDMAQYGAEILLQELSPEQVKRIAGEEAIWPQLAKADIYDLVTVEIRAGSAGKPNKAREQQTWGTLLPQLYNGAMQYAAAVQTGNTVLAESIRALARQTLMVFDERLEVDEFFPPQQQQSMGMGQPGLGDMIMGGQPGMPPRPGLPMPNAPGVPPQAPQGLPPGAHPQPPGPGGPFHPGPVTLQ